jgi:hypothetical protein
LIDIFTLISADYICVKCIFWLLLRHEQKNAPGEVYVEEWSLLESLISPRSRLKNLGFVLSAQKIQRLRFNWYGQHQQKKEMWVWQQ